MRRKSEFRIGKGHVAPRAPAGVDAGEVVVKGLGFFAADPGEAGRFLDWSGLDASSLRAAAADPGFALGLLDYFSQNLISLEAFCAAAAIEPRDVIALHESLRVRGLTSHDEG